MLQLMHKTLDPESMEILYDKPFTGISFVRDFEVKGGEWTVQDGWLVGRNPENAPGMVISKADYFGPVLMEFDCRTVLPCTHDVNVMWRGSWNTDTNTRHVAYVAGLQGWWDGKLGFEKSPGYKLTVGTPLFQLEPGKTYHVTVGDIHGHVFIAIDGKLALELTDPDPIDDRAYGKIGFEAYCSWIAFKNLKIRRCSWTEADKSYVPEF